MWRSKVWTSRKTWHHRGSSFHVKTWVPACFSPATRNNRMHWPLLVMQNRLQEPNMSRRVCVITTKCCKDVWGGNVTDEGAQNRWRPVAELTYFCMLMYNKYMYTYIYITWSLLSLWMWQKLFLSPPEEFKINVTISIYLKMFKLIYNIKYITNSLINQNTFPQTL